MDVLEHFDALVQVYSEVDMLLDLTLAHTEESFLWPLAEPVKSTAGHKGRELSKSLPEDFSKRGHCDDHVDVRLESVKILLEHIQRNHWHVFLHAQCLADLVDGFVVFLFVEVADITTVENIVDVFKHLLLNDLGVHENERSGFVVATALHEHLLHIFAPVHELVTLDNFNLEYLVVGTESGKARQTLASGTTHSEKERVTQRLSDNTGDSCNVVASIQEHHKVHLSLN